MTETGPSRRLVRFARIAIFMAGLAGVGAGGIVLLKPPIDSIRTGKVNVDERKYDERGRRAYVTQEVRESENPARFWPPVAMRLLFAIAMIAMPVYVARGWRRERKRTGRAWLDILDTWSASLVPRR